jgi:hypothetical protein
MNVLTTITGILSFIGHSELLLLLLVYKFRHSESLKFCLIGHFLSC